MATPSTERSPPNHMLPSVLRTASAAITMAAASIFLGSAACGPEASAVIDPGGEGGSQFRISIEPEKLQLFAGDTGSFSASVHGTGASLPPDATAAWSSSDPNVAAVDATGKVEALGAGTARIVASSHGASDTARLNVSPQPPRAFPGAQGYGAKALTGCDRSNLQILRVTNLEPNGPGSFESALRSVDDDALSVVIFDASGYIDAPRLQIRSGCLYVAGQTAPGDGVTIRGNGGLDIRGSVHDVVLRHLRIRGGHATTFRGHIAVWVASGHNIILDHLSLGWTGDKTLMISKYNASWSHPIHRITVQRSLIHEPLASHPTAVQISAENRTVAPISQVDFHHNLIANSSHRNPNGVSSGLKVVNNVVYNWNQGAGQGGNGKAVIDWINNYFQPGPMTKYPYEVTHFIQAAHGDPSFYVRGNVGPHNQDPHAGPDAQWSGPNRVVACYYDCGDYGSAGDPLPTWVRRDEPLPNATMPIQVELATEAYESVLTDVGANARLRCNGDVVRNTDQVDERILENVRTRTGPESPPVTELAFGGFPTIKSAETNCSDTDSDGMPDSFESRHGFKENDSRDNGADPDSDGYTNLEEYLNGSDPLRPSG